MVVSTNQGRCTSSVLSRSLVKVLISAYACEPGKGSEPGVGWHWVVAAARDHEAWVVTRRNNREAIERSLASQRSINAKFVYVDLPPWLRSWKRGSRGVRLYYVIWQVLALRAARRLNRSEEFDLVHHLTFANIWLPALTCLTGPPFVLGPVGGGPTVPLRLYGALGIRGAASELLLLLRRSVSRVIPIVRQAWRRADAILVQNEETLQALPADLQAKCSIRPNAVAALDGDRSHHSRPVSGDARRHHVVCAGRLLPWKGFALAISMMKHLPLWKLTIVGDGADRKRLERLAHRLGVANRVRFCPWMSQSDLWELLDSSTCLVLPSLRDDSPLIVAESQALGVPVVAFNQGGPRVLSKLEGTVIALAPFGSSPADSAQALAATVIGVRGKRAAGVLSLGPDGVQRDLASVYDRVLATRNIARRMIVESPNGLHPQTRL
jgi:glycosyltransferase involved in cell wall biosynthesis